MAKYGWYAQIVQDDIRSRLQKLMEQDGGLPKEKSNAIVKVVLNERGMVVEYRIMNPSGIERFDRAIKQALERLTLRQPPPEGMPRSMNIRVSTQG
jgi:TonB family protein